MGQSVYKPEVAEELIEWLASGQTLRAFCRLPDKPSWRAIYDWIDANDEFASRIARARDLGADAIAEEALSIADTTVEGVVLTTDDKGTKVVRGDMLGHRKLQVDTRLKLLAKWNPGKYGDKIEQTLRGDVSAPLKFSIVDAKL
jgi:hypothetical protein